MCWHIAEQNQWWFYLSRKELSDGLPGQREQYPSCIGWEEEEEEEEEDPISDFLPLRCPVTQKGGAIYPKLNAQTCSPLEAQAVRRSTSKRSTREVFCGSTLMYSSSKRSHCLERREETRFRVLQQAKMTSFERKKREKELLSGRFRIWQKKLSKMHDFLKDGFLSARK